ncbi:MAG: TetR/AcrR family transcriptional regulator [Clostridia bacterium]|nr:TetR/AcrR family transcriptional regulator [Clostridia bacterium]
MNDGVVDSIVDLASSLIEERGAYGMSLGEIAAGLHISKGTLSYHFPTKQSLLNAAAEHCIKTVGDRLFAWVDSVGGAPAEEALGALCEAMLDSPGLRLFVRLYNAAEPESRLEETVDRAMNEWNVMLEVGALRMKPEPAARMKRVLPAVLPFLCGLAALNADGDYAKQAFVAFVLG